MNSFSKGLGIFGISENIRKKTKTVLAILITFVIVVVILAIILLNNYSGNLNSELSGNLIRLHVVANSDSPEDQAVKRNVRDAVLDYMNEELDSGEDIEGTRQLLKSRLNEITNVAENEIMRCGRNDKVTADLGDYPFPTKAYGDIKLPAGNYQALKVVIGKGEGANWWCVLFPPLCFVDVTHGTVPDFAKERLKEALPEEEYDIVTMADDEDDIPIKIKFKIVELFQDSKLKAANALSRIFGNAG